MIKESVLKSFGGKNVLVTGGTGLIGRQVMDMLCKADAHVKTVSLDKVKINEKADHLFGDLTSFELCMQVTRDIDFAFHLAGVKGSIDVTKTKPASHFVPVLMFNTNLLEACRLNKVKKVLYTSSIGAYESSEIFRESQNENGPPMDFFAGWAKRMGELQIQAYKIQYGLDNFSIVRPCNVYGPGDNFDPDNAMVIPSLMSKILRGDDPVVVWGDGSAVRDFAYSKDIAEGAILALYHGTHSQYVNLGSGKGCSVKELVEALRSSVDFNYIFDLTKSAGFPKRVMDITLARKMIDYDPTTSLSEGLKATWQWFVKNQTEYTKKKNYFKEAI
ncbi:MAG: NAD-dependent epimerase/dehydratase family protein [Candidatus Omnitrophica bacterium]|nr:NAD-dependent epimerase/dehydratase family protein [Candidatus Omnitrophota bacterium]